jgi:hypothetical protein
MISLSLSLSHTHTHTHTPSNAPLGTQCSTPRTLCGPHPTPPLRHRPVQQHRHNQQQPLHYRHRPSDVCVDHPGQLCRASPGLPCVRELHQLRPRSAHYPGAPRPDQPAHWCLPCGVVWYLRWSPLPHPVEISSQLGFPRISQLPAWGVPPLTYAFKFHHAFKAAAHVLAPPELLSASSLFNSPMFPPMPLSGRSPAIEAAVVQCTCNGWRRVKREHFHRLCQTTPRAPGRPGQCCSPHRSVHDVCTAHCRHRGPAGGDPSPPQWPGWLFLLPVDKPHRRVGGAGHVRGGRGQGRGTGHQQWHGCSHNRCAWMNGDPATGRVCCLRLRAPA